MWSELDWVTKDYKNKTLEIPDWRKCKLLGSLLDTDKDIERRKGLTALVINTLNYIFKSKLKLGTFAAYASSIFLYMFSELWTLTNTKNNQINAFHRRQLRNVIGFGWPKKISNQDLYKLTKQEHWSKTFKRRRLNWFGHLMRLFLDNKNSKWSTINNKNTHPKEKITLFTNLTEDRSVWRAYKKGLMEDTLWKVPEEG